MNIIPIAPVPGGGANAIGNGQAFFMSPNAPQINPGEPWTIFMSGELPNHGEIGAMMPWDAGYTYVGGTDANGNLTITGTCTATSTQTITDGNGIMLASGILPGGSFYFLGVTACKWGPLMPPPAAIPPGIPALVAALENSWNTHVRVADINLDAVPFNSIPYLANEPWSAGPLVVYVPTSMALQAGPSQTIATLLGGTVVQLPPNGLYLGNLVGVAPLVNWITGVNVNGVNSKASAADLAMAFQMRNAPGGITAAITNCFVPA